MTALAFDRDFSPHYGQAMELTPGVRRVTCENPGPFTFWGTNSYIIGEGEVAILDPGPADQAHIDAILAATEGEVISHILISHTHADHSPGALLLQRLSGAPIYAEGPHRPARPLHLGERNPLDAAADLDLSIDHLVTDGMQIQGKGWLLDCIHTPGHTTNHLSFAFADGSGMFSADHVMACSTSIVAPPDGSMAEFINSLEKLMTRQDAVFWPGHGGPVKNPAAFLVGLKEHRLGREQALIDRLHAGEETISEMVATVYRDTDPSLHGAAGLSMFAQMEYLIERGRVACLDDIPSLSARYQLVE